MPTKKTDAAIVLQDGVHTSAQTDPATDDQAQQPAGCGGCGGDCADCNQKPAHHQPSEPSARDAYTGKGGQYVRDPKTGERTPLIPTPKTGEQQPAGQ